MLRNRVMLCALVGALALVGCDDDDDDEASNQYTASLNGQNERPTPVQTSATGTFSLTDNGTSMSYILTVNGLPSPGVTAGGAHIHIAPPPRAAADTSGGVIVNLNPTQNITSGVLAQGSFTAGNTISLDSVRTLLNNGRAYVNVHTPANLGGHIRGTIVRN